MIGNISGQGGETGPVRMFSPEWYELTLHAFREANRVSVDLMMFNGPGWSQSGGPWIKPEQSMCRVAWSEYPAQGGAFSRNVRPDGILPGHDIAVLAVPRLPVVTIQGEPGAPSPDGGAVLRFAHTGPFTARSLAVHGKGSGQLYALLDGERHLVAEIHAAGGRPGSDFLPDAVETFSFPDVTAREFELVPAFACRVELGSAPVVAQVIEKQTGRMHPTPSPTWESYIFPDTAEPADAGPLIKRQSLIDLTDQLGSDGTLDCTLPAGDWTVIHFGMVTTGSKNGPAPPEATGLEVDKIAENYVGGLREIAHENKLRLWCENYGHWGFPGEFTVYGGYADEIGGEFWSTNRLGTIECRAASSSGHLYGKRRTYAEAFTSKLSFGHHPATIKARGEELFCAGVNHFVLHVYAHQPRDGAPGTNPWFGTAFHRNTPWFMESRDWVRYLQRCHFLLQQGEPVADVAVYIGDFAPQMTGPANPVPPGYDYDFNRLQVLVTSTTNTKPALGNEVILQTTTRQPITP